MLRLRVWKKISILYTLRNLDPWSIAPWLLFVFFPRYKSVPAALKCIKTLHKIIESNAPPKGFLDASLFLVTSFRQVFYLCAALWQNSIKMKKVLYPKSKSVYLKWRYINFKQQTAKRQLSVVRIGTYPVKSFCARRDVVFYLKGRIFVCCDRGECAMEWNVISS